MAVRRAAAVATTVLAGTVLAGPVLAACRGGGSAPPASTTTAPPPPPQPELVPIVRTPAAWRITYRLEEGDPSAAVVSTDEVHVRRPFDSRLATRAGAPPGGAEQSRQVASFTRRTLVAGTAQPLTLAVSPGVPASDVRVGPVLPALVAAGVAVRGSVRDVAGRRCQVLRTGGLLSATALVAPTPAEHAESCVDEAGLVLEEVLVGDGRRLSRRVAVEVEEAATFPDDLFPSAVPTVGPVQGGGSVRRMAPGSKPPGEFLALPAPPAGFEPVGRFSVVPPERGAAEGAEQDPTSLLSRRAATVDVWRRGPDLLVVEQGSTVGGSQPFEPTPGAPPADLGPFGRGEVVLSALEPAVRVLRGGGRYLRVAGSLPPEELAAVGRSLVAEPGGELRFVD